MSQKGIGDEKVIKGETVEKTVYKCPECGHEYPDEETAKTCYFMTVFLKLIKQLYMEEGGGFLLKKGEVIPVSRIITTPCRPCIHSHVQIKLVSSNDELNINQYNVREWLGGTLENISLTKAVELGWRAYYQGCWEARATAEMNQEYIEAIDRIIDGMTEQDKRAILRKALMFKSGH